MAIALIDRPDLPRYEVDFHEIVPEHEDTALARIQNAALPGILAYVEAVIYSLGDAIWTNFEYIGTSFRYIVMGYDGYIYHPPESQEGAIFRFAIWAGAHVLGVLILLGVNLYNRIYSMPSQLAAYIHPEIHAGHVTSKHLNIDVSGVPEDVRARNLLQLFDAIEFEDRNNPNFMHENARNESGVIYTPAQLRESLTTFINHIEARDAFLGTPPAVALPKLMQFYEQLESAVRFSIHAVNNNLQTFLDERQQDGLPRPGDDDYNEYRDLLQAKARLAIDFAIAGRHCGARYMGDAVDAYLGLKGEGDFQAMTLRDSLVEHLASERETIARGQIQEHLGADTHKFSAYMANLGQLLGIPGTENVVEYLGGWGFDRPRMLELFFEAYTPDRIRQSVQEKIHSSESFRTKVYDWMKDQVEGWNEADQRQAVLETLRAFPSRAQLHQEAVEDPNVRLFLQLLQDLPAEDLRNLPRNSWEDYVRELLRREQAREKIAEKFPVALVSADGTPRPPMQINLEKHRKRGAFEAALKQADLAPILQSIAWDNDNPAIVRSDQERAIEEYERKKEYVRRVDQLFTGRGLPSLDREVTLRIYLNEANRDQVVQDHLSIERSARFLAGLIGEVDEAHPHRLPDNVLNWVLISQGILKAPE